MNLQRSVFPLSIVFGLLWNLGSLYASREVCVKQIIAIGGSSFNLEPRNLEMDRYILSLVQHDEPARVGFLGHASDDNPVEIAAFYSAYNQLGARTSHFLLRDPNRSDAQIPADFESFLRNLDVVFVGGGRTRQMVEAWKKHGIDQQLRMANERGVILAGVSAGGMCWFASGVTSSDGPLSVISPLGFIRASFVPHAECQDQRLPHFQQSLRSSQIIPGYALDDHTMLHFIGGKLHGTFKAHPDKRARYLSAENGNVIERDLAPQLLDFHSFVVREAAMSDLPQIKYFLEQNLGGLENAKARFRRLYLEDSIHIRVMVAVENQKILGVAELVESENPKEVIYVSAHQSNDSRTEEALLESARVRAALFGLTMRFERASGSD